MKAKSLCMFRTKLHLQDAGTVLIAPGQVFEGDEGHLRDLARNRLVMLIEDDPIADAPGESVANETAGDMPAQPTGGEAATEDAAGESPAPDPDAPQTSAAGRNKGK
jgi:hypothetical protein